MPDFVEIKIPYSDWDSLIDCVQGLMDEAEDEATFMLNFDVMNELGALLFPMPDLTEVPELASKIMIQRVSPRTAGHITPLIASFHACDPL